MTATTAAAIERAGRAADAGTIPDAGARGAPARPLDRFAAAQALNTARHVAALRPFRPDEFGTGPASPSEAHIRAANTLLADLRRGLRAVAAQVDRASAASAADPTPDNLLALIALKERGGQWVKLVERTWHYYLSLFEQRQTRFADWLLAADRVALECYQAVYTGLGQARSVPSPGPLCCIETAGTPSTFRRGVPLGRLARRGNPFPVIQLPYPRLVNPWTLGAIHHEVSHNIQSDLGLWTEVPRRINRRLREAGMPPVVRATWTRWHKETWADLCGLLLGGPAVVASLIDVVAMSPASTLAFNHEGVHPTSYLRVLISVELLRRMGFPAEAEAYERLWTRLYPAPRRSAIPPAVLDTFPEANALVVDTICYQPYHQLGDRSLAQTVAFRPTHERMTREAAERIAAGTDPGIIPARFLVGATRWAVDRRLASPGRITRNFYQALVRR